VYRKEFNTEITEKDRAQSAREKKKNRPGLPCRDRTQKRRTTHNYRASHNSTSRRLPYVSGESSSVKSGYSWKRKTKSSSLEAA